MGTVRARRRVADALIKGCGLWHLHNSRPQRLFRAVLDEIDLQHLRSTQPCPEISSRDGMYQHIQTEAIKEEAIDFLEFGVFRGESMRAWIALNRHAQSRFYGFDSFEGLPETWRKSQDAGHFSVAGNIPQLDDNRVRFIKGWFDKTVPEFVGSFEPRNRLVVHLDADLYSSTMIALVYLLPYLAKGSLLIFDEFYDRNHEYKAFRDFLSISRRKYQAVCHTENYGKVCIELI
jgi:hypothetical protein